MKKRSKIWSTVSFILFLILQLHVMAIDHKNEDNHVWKSADLKQYDIEIIDEAKVRIWRENNKSWEEENSLESLLKKDSKNNYFFKFKFKGLEKLERLIEMVNLEMSYVRKILAHQEIDAHMRWIDSIPEIKKKGNFHSCIIEGGLILQKKINDKNYNIDLSKSDLLSRLEKLYIHNCWGNIAKHEHKSNKINVNVRLMISPANIFIDNDSIKIHNFIQKEYDRDSVTKFIKAWPISQKELSEHINISKSIISKLKNENKYGILEIKAKEFWNNLQLYEKNIMSCVKNDKHIKKMADNLIEGSEMNKISVEMKIKNDNVTNPIRFDAEVKQEIT